MGSYWIDQQFLPEFRFRQSKENYHFFNLVKILL